MNRSSKLTVAAALLCATAYGAVAAKVKVPVVKVVVAKVSKKVAAVASVFVAEPTPAFISPGVMFADLGPSVYYDPSYEIPVPVPVAVPAAAPAPTLGGVNLSGGDFGTVPGRLWYDYTYPTNADIDYFASRGFKLIRIPFRWERLQPTLYGALSEPDRAALKAAVTYAAGKGLKVVLDMHDYAHRAATPGAASSLVGSAAVSGSALADAWTKIAADYRGNDAVWLGLMNEPYEVSAADWWKTVQQLVTDLRGQQVVNKVLVPGVSWTGAHSWISSGNAAQAEKFSDPGNNFAFEVHQYLDGDSSGTNPACSAGAANRVDAVITWATQRKVQLFVGEMGASGDASCASEYPAMLKKLNSSGVVLGWAAWGGGSWWSNSYLFKLSPITGQDATPHLALLLKNLPS